MAKTESKPTEGVTFHSSKSDYRIQLGDTCVVFQPYPKGKIGGFYTTADEAEIKALHEWTKKDASHLSTQEFGIKPTARPMARQAITTAQATQG